MRPRSRRSWNFNIEPWDAAVGRVEWIALTPEYPRCNLTADRADEIGLRQRGAAAAALAGDSGYREEVRALSLDEPARLRAALPGKQGDGDKRFWRDASESAGSKSIRSDTGDAGH